MAKEFAFVTAVETEQSVNEKLSALKERVAVLSTIRIEK